jgi:hypothetical protein
MYLTSFIHREQLFEIAERWICGRPASDDIERFTEILICDGFVLGEFLENFIGLLLGILYEKPFTKKHIHSKGELRDVLTRNPNGTNPRLKELFSLYQKNPDYFYREAPINGVVCLDDGDHLLGIYRIKRSKRIAEKSNRRIARWIFQKVQSVAQDMAGERARQSQIPLEWFVTPPEEMIREFIRAEEEVAQSFKEGQIEFDRSALTLCDVGAIKIIADSEKLNFLEKTLFQHSGIRVIEKEDFKGNYQATNLILEIGWDAEQVCRTFRNHRGWEKYLDRGIPESRLKKGLDPLLEGAQPTLIIELILSTFPDLVESELGKSIHEERIIAQRGDNSYRGFIPINVEFLIEYLFAAGFSPKKRIEHVPIKLWGRYLPETLSSYVRGLYNLPEQELSY